ncbi:MAG: cytochrome c peroxidase [Leptospirales bacterium]
MKTLHFTLLISLSLSFLFCKPSAATLALMEEAKDTFGIVPDTMPGSENDTPERIELGKKLYFDVILSKDDTISCNSCHNLNEDGNGTDNAAVSTGIDGQQGGRSAPTVLNAGFHIAQFWDGRAENLKEQAKGPILNPIEMGMKNANAVISKLKATEDYPELFKKAFPDAENALTYDNLAEAIAAFERTLISKNRLDNFIAGSARALTSDEQTGLRIFLDTGCTNCHNGVAIGGSMYQKIGLVNEFETKDLGRFEVTNNGADKFVFKVPSLRKIAETGPYFHDGSIATLKEAIKKMAWHQLGAELKEDEVNKIEAFLKALN